MRKSVAARPEIGGYFGLDLPDHGDAFPNAIKLQSARAALRAVIESSRSTRALLPGYLCESAIQAVVAAGARVETYALDDSLYPANLPRVGEGRVLVYVNYFGLCGANVERLMQEVPRDKLVIDNAQALLARPTDSLATIYSPRKFIGVPDGGLLMTSRLEVSMPRREDALSIGRMRHLLERMAGGAQEGYVHYVEAEESLRDSTPLLMSRLTKRLLASIDMSAVRERRRANFVALASILDDLNTSKWKLEPDSVPLCYPLVTNFEVDRIRKELAERRIYLPTYWPEFKPERGDGIEARLQKRCLPVPCDQRYSVEEMSDLAAEMRALLVPTGSRSL